MYKHKFLTGIIVLLLVICLSSCGCSSEPTPLLYKVTDSDGDCVWLFGSIHVATDDLYPLPDYVMDAYNQSNALAVECDTLALENDTAAIQALQTTMMYQDGASIDKHIDQELYQKARAILKENHSYEEYVDVYMPIMWSSMIDNICVAKWGYDGDIGIDVHLMENAKANGKELREIESVEKQYQMLASFSPALQEMLLKNSVENYANPLGHLSFSMLANAWKSGDSETLGMLVTSSPEDLSKEEKALYEEYNKAMMTDRNILMTDYAESALSKGDTLFICVGAAHVVGDGGMADLLEDRGYTVEIVTPSE